MKKLNKILLPKCFRRGTLKLVLIVFLVLHVAIYVTWKVHGLEYPSRSTSFQDCHQTVPFTVRMNKQPVQRSAQPPAASAELNSAKRHAPEYNASAGIPQIIHQVFASELVFESYQPFIKGCLALNPNWTYYLWRDKDAEALIASEYPKFLATYKNYPDRLQRADSVRYIVLHRFGGIYMDMDVQCVKPFFPALGHLNSFLDQERLEQTNIVWGLPFSAMNSAMGSAPGHPFFLKVIEEMLGHSVGNVFETTGPAALTKVYRKYIAANPVVPIKLLNPRVMSPQIDSKIDWRGRCTALVAAKAKPESKRSFQERGCIILESKNWRHDETDESTICVHRFLHLGYGKNAANQKFFNATAYFWPRIQTFL